LSKSSKKNGMRAAAILSSLTGLPTESITDVPILLVKGRGETVIDGCTGVLEYSDTRICLNMDGHRLSICGTGLTMSDFRRNCMTVRGRIVSLSWEEDGDV